MTLRMIEAFGGSTEVEGNTYIAKGPLSGASVSIEPDASAASYAFAAAVATQGSVTVPHLTADSLQGDVAFVDILAKMGAQVEHLDAGIRVSAGHNLRGIEVDMHHVSDTVMTLAALAPLANGPTTITNVPIFASRKPTASVRQSTSCVAWGSMSSTVMTGLK